MSVTTKPATTLQVLRPKSFAELAQFATMAAKSSMVPPGFRGKPEDIMLAIQMGSELGLAPMQALQNIAVINNRPSVWGDAMLGLCRASVFCEGVSERIEGEGDKMEAICIAKRHGDDPVTGKFSVEDAKKAGLWGKQGPWQQYPKRMLQMRARGFALRDAFPDVLRGLIAAEEAQDMSALSPPAGPTIDGHAEPVGTRDAINSAVPLADEPTGPEYPFATAQGGIHYTTGSDYIDAWRRLIAACRHQGVPEKIVSAHGLNRAQIEAVRAFDPRAAEEVEAMVVAASGVGAAVTEDVGK